MFNARSVRRMCSGCLLALMIIRSPPLGFWPFPLCWPQCVPFLPNNSSLNDWPYNKRSISRVGGRMAALFICISKSGTFSKSPQPKLSGGWVFEFFLISFSRPGILSKMPRSASEKVCPRSVVRLSLCNHQHHIAAASLRIKAFGSFQGSHFACSFRQLCIISNVRSSGP